MWKIGENLNRK